MLEKYIKNQKLRNIAEWLLAIIVAVLAYYIINGYIFGTAEVSGPSMNPTLNHGDRIILNKLVYKLGRPEKGDIIAFPYPADPKDKLIKRIVGIPGDVIEIYDNRFYINGDILADDFSAEDLMSIGDVSFPLTVGDDEYFVLGDNRNNSKDSRSSSVGLIQRKNIIGKASIRFMPFSSFGSIK